MKKTVYCLLLFMAVFYSPAFSAEYQKAPLDIQVTLFSKLFLFNNHFIRGEEITVYVLDSPEFAAEFRKSVGKKIGKAEITSVQEGKELPSEKPSVIYLGNPDKTDALVRYTRSHKVLSITGHPSLIAKGITLGVGVYGQKPKILFNPLSSEKEGMDWNPVILKIVEMIK
ncbi:MAG: YfiR/HmsC family protein [Desulfococcaceae bacterium]|nr:YfiR/HmsC family protein [Desulfococcaceae bacterium]